MADDVARVVAELGDAGGKIVERAWRLGCREVERLAKAKDMVPFGHYGAKRGKAGRPGGALKASLRVVVVGRVGNEMVALCVSDLPYARRQHEEDYHHPGLYTRGHAGPKYRAAYFERAVEMVFGEGQDPLGKYSGSPPKTFQQILEFLAAQEQSG